MRMREVECGACMAAVPVSRVIPLINLTTVHSPVTMQTMFAVMGLQLLGGLLCLRIESQYDTCFFPMFRVLAYCLLIVVYHTKTSRTVSFFLSGFARVSYSCSECFECPLYLQGLCK